MEHPVKRLPLFTIVATGVFMSTLDSSMVNIALPSIMEEFHSSLYSTKWVVMIYLLTITALLLFWGHLGDRFGRRRIYSLGMLIFGISSFGAGLTPNISLLITSRCIQAIGASMMMSTGPALIRNYFPKAHLGRNLGLIGVAVSMGLMTGPSLGGVLIEYFSWRAIFFITAPIGLIFSLLAWFFLPPSATDHDDENFDAIGNIIWAASVTCAVLVLANPPTNWKNPLLYVTAVGGLAIFSFFIRHEKSIPNPLFPLHLFKRKFFSIAIACSLLSFSILFSVTLLTPFYLDRVIGLSTSHIGIVMMSLPLSVLVIAPISGWISDFVGARYLTTAGLLTSTISLFLLARLATTTTPIDIAWRLSILGAGQAMFLAPNSASVLANVQNKYAGVSAGLLATARNFGMLLGVAQTGMIFSFVFGRTTGGLDLSDFTEGQSFAFMNALHVAFSAALVIGLGATFLSWMRGKGLRKTRRTKEHDTDVIV